MSSTSLPSLPPLSPPPSHSNTTSSSHQPIPSAQRTAEARAAFVASLQAVGQSLSTDLHSRARTIHENAKALSEQEKKLAKSTKQLQKETAQLERFVEKSSKGGKGPMSEFDDLEGLLGGLEGELDVLERTLGFVEGDVDELEGGAAGEGEAVGAGDAGAYAARDGMEGVQSEGLDVSDAVKGKQREV